MDLFLQKIIGWALNERLHVALVTAALDMAVERRQPSPGLLHLSDWGSQYTGEAYKHALEQIKAL